jgi:8-oxo-dGTP diphosphatase
MSHRGGNISTSQQRVNCAVAVVVTHTHKVLFGRRRTGRGDFEWQLPGGWLKVGESPLQAARREVREETGLLLRELHFVGTTSNVFSAHNHSLSLYFEAECVDAGSLIETEQEKCDGWEWRCWADVTDKLFLPLSLLKQTEYRPFFQQGQQACVST